MRVEFRVLGPLEIRVDGRVVPVPAGRTRVLLATLLLRANRFVSVDELVDRLWDGDPPNPDRAKATLQMVVTRLRQALGDANCVCTMTGGYQASIDPDQLDLARFRALVAAEDFTSALALWRGPLLANVASEALHRDDVPPLLEEHLVALERRIDSDLERGLTGELVAELSAITAAHPLRERFWGQLMRALFTSGRQGEALAAHLTIRDCLADELGVDPGAELQDLHRQMLGGSLSAPSHRLVPRQLPASTPHFVGRAGELAELTTLLNGGTVVISAIKGTGGVGKTMLAVHWARDVAARFPDGQLYVNLRGFDPHREPMEPADAIRRFLDAFGVPAERIPVDLDAQAAMYRSLVADRRVLVLLDNARDVEQVRPLLPGGPSCLVLVTSRNQLTGLVVREGACPLTLDMLSHGEAVALLARSLGEERVRAESDQVDELVARCAGLPMALAIVSARAALEPHLPLRVLVEELVDASTRLDALEAGDSVTGVRSVFSWSYRQLSPAAAGMFRLLSLHPGPDISVPAAASLAGRDLRETREALAELTGAHLLTQHVARRFAFHDLLRVYATERAEAEEAEEALQAAVGRMTDHYLHTLAQAERMFSGVRRQIELDAPRQGVRPEVLPDRAQADAWFMTEHQVLAAVVNHADSDRHAWQLVWSMWGFFGRLGYWQNWLPTVRAGLAAAERLGDVEQQAQFRRCLGEAHCRITLFDDALVEFGIAARLSEQIGHRAGVVRAYAGMAWAFENQGRFDDAIDLVQRSLELQRAEGGDREIAGVLVQLGGLLGMTGAFEEGLAHCTEAQALNKRYDDPYQQANILEVQGTIHCRTGAYEEAVHCQLAALELFERAGPWQDKTISMNHLGDAYLGMDDRENARRWWTEALTILEDQGHSDAEEIKAKLACLDRDQDVSS